MSATARKKLRFQITPSDGQLWAIGMVAVQWTAIESFITVFAHAAKIEAAVRAA